MSIKVGEGGEIAVSTFWAIFGENIYFPVRVFYILLVFLKEK